MPHFLLYVVGFCLLIWHQSAYAQMTFPTPDAYSPEASAHPMTMRNTRLHDRISAIEVVGNQRVADETVRSYLNVKEGEALDDARLNQSVKSLYGTGLFSDVQVEEVQGNVRVNVKENPVINRVRFEGNEELKEEDLLAELPFSSRSVYTKTKVQQSVERIAALYRKSGRFHATISPKIVPLSQNRVDVVYEIDEGDVTHVEKILFVGNEAFDSAELREVILTEETRWYDFLTSNDTYDGDRLEFDKEKLRRFYTSHGYADFRVTSAVAEISPSGDGFYLTFSVEEGVKYRFGTVMIDSSIDDVDTVELRMTLSTHMGETFDAEAVDSSIESLTDALGSKGYAFVNIEPELDTDKEDRLIDVTYHIEPSPRVYVERINVTGNVRTLDKVIRREFRFSEGDPFSTSKLKRSEQRIKNLGYFGDVRITTEQGSAPDRAVINVDVEEQSTGELSLGAGFSTADGALADIGVRENNLMGAGKKLRANLTLAQLRQQIDVGYTEPYFMNKEIAAGVDVFKIQQNWRNQSSYDQQMTGGRLRASYALTEHLDHTLSYTLREDVVENVDSAASRFIRDQAGAYATSAIGHVLMYDYRDDRFLPNEGFFVRFSQDLAGLGGNAKYVRNELRSAYYYPIVDDWVLQMTGNGGYVWGYTDSGVRINDRFFIGVNQMRGFRQAGIGPRDTSTTDALGGNMYYTAGTELRFPLPIGEDDAFLGGVFVDAGSLWNVDDSGPTVADDPFALRVSTGMGVAWRSPFGPIRLDFGQALLKKSYDQTQIVRFSFGTQF